MSEAQVLRTEPNPMFIRMKASMFVLSMHAVKFPKQHQGYFYSPEMARYESGWLPVACEPIGNPYIPLEDKVDFVQRQFRPVGKHIRDTFDIGSRLAALQLVCLEGVSEWPLNDYVMSNGEVLVVEEVLPPERIIKSLFIHWIDHPRPTTCLPLKKYILSHTNPDIT